MKGLLSKIIIKYRCTKLTAKNGIDGVIIKDYGSSYAQISRGSISGYGSLILCPNCIDIHEFMKLRIDSEAKLIINGNVKLFTYTNIHILEKATLTIGNGSYINEGTLISIRHRTSIGDNCAISNNVTIFDSDFHNIDRSGKDETGITIGNHCWIGANATILKNVSVGNNCIIGANAVLTHSIPDNCMVAGNPAVIVKKNVNWN